MGGVGSGRRYQFGKNTTSDCRAVDVRHWHQKQLLQAGHSFSWQWSRNGQKVASIQVSVKSDRVTLSYRHRRGDDDWTDQEYDICLDRTPCNYGGMRTWFLCPARGCGRRVAKLFLGGRIFACRHCYRLAYACQRERLGDRAVRKAGKIRERLGWEGGFLNGGGWKPKGMHWETFRQLKAQHDALLQQYAETAWQQLRAIDRRFSNLKLK
jgi:hypothetical protein